jgi:nucleotide-binding universal stress UspA family protein
VVARTCDGRSHMSLRTEPLWSAEKQTCSVLAAVDGTPASKDVLDMAIELALHDNCTVTVLLVREAPSHMVVPAMPPLGIHLPRRSEAQCDVVLGEAVSYVRSHGVSAHAELREGTPRVQIVQAATEHGDSVIVVSCPSHGAVEKLIRGWVCTNVAKRAPCRVVCVPKRGPATGSR